MITIPPELEPVALVWMTQTLQARGAKVLWPGDDAEFVSPITLYRSLPVPRIPLTTFYTRLRSPSCPKVSRRESPTGRLLELSPTAELRMYLMREAQPGRTL